jgi:hypothetical protein
VNKEDILTMTAKPDKASEKANTPVRSIENS